MGYSCTVKAGATETLISRLHFDGSNYNSTHFYEIGRENNDGSITGTVYKYVGKNLVRKQGSFRIDADGKIVRFPGLKKEEKEKINKMVLGMSENEAMEISYK